MIVYTGSVNGLVPNDQQAVTRTYENKIPNQCQKAAMS